MKILVCGVHDATFAKKNHRMLGFDCEKKVAEHDNFVVNKAHPTLQATSF